ncbi:MAG: Ig-like domain-containing protein [Paludibacter sp.]|nr:Ig-like domain-containing protein [Paludibacter sp.]
MKRFLLLPLFLFCITTIYGATITVSVVYKGSGSAYGTNTNTITITTPILGSSFKFTSANPADVSFSGNNIAGQLSFTSGGQLYTFNGVISRKAASGSTDNAYYFYETTVLGGATATGQAWLLLVPGRESFISDNTTVGTNSSGVGTGLETLRTTQSTNTAPVITSDGGGQNATVSVSEGQTAVTDVNATDAENNIASYSITGGSDASKFSMNSFTGVLTFVSTPDYENPTDIGLNNVYNVQVTVTDTQGAADVQEIAVSVTNINDNTPVIISDGGGATASVNVLQSSLAVTIVKATDADAGDVITYSISGGTNAALFNIDVVTGNVSFKSAAQIGSYTVQVKATDRAGHYDTQDITVNVTATDQTPPTLTITADDDILASGESCIVTFKFSEYVQGFTLSDIIVSGGVISNFAMNLYDPTSFTATLTQSGSGTAPSVTVNDNTYTDLNNNNGKGDELLLDYDIISPTVAVTFSTATIATGETKIVTFTFSEDPEHSFSTEDISVSNGQLYNLIQTSDSKVWTASVKATSSVLAPTITVIDHSYTDPAGNLGSSGTNSFTLAAPSIDLANTSSSDTGISSSDNITSNRKPVLTGLSSDNLAATITVEYYSGTILNALTYSNVSVSSLMFTLDLNGTSPSSGTMPTGGLPEGYVTIKITTNGGATATNSFLIDLTNPATPVVNSQTTYDNTPTLTGTANLTDEDVLTVTLNGITYTNGDGYLAVDGTAWTLNVPFSNKLSANTYSVQAKITDPAGNYATGSGSLTILPTTLTVSLEHTTTSDTGSSSTDSYTSNQEPVITGTVSGDDTAVNITIVSGDVSYVYDNVAVSSGVYRLDLSAVAPSQIIPPGNFPAYGLPEGAVDLQVEGVSSGAIGTGSFEIFLTYTTTADGDWTSDSKWDTNTNPNSETVKTHVKNNIVIPASTTITVNEVTVDDDATLTNSNGGTLTVSSGGYIVLKVGSNNDAAKIKNDGSIINNGKIIIRKSFSRTFGWYFMSFPFDVPAANIFIAGTNTVARWGDPTTAATSTNDFYVSEYDGERRDNTGDVNYVQDSPNWKDVSPHTLIAKKGYIIAVPSDIEIDFVSGAGEISLFTPSSSTVDVDEYTNNTLSLHNSWNLVGTPYAAGFNLDYATQPPFYHFNNINYDVVLSGDNLIIDPYTSFFMQATSTTMDFSVSGKALVRSLVTNPSYDDVSFNLEGNGYSDKTRFRLDDSNSLEYVIGEDAVKMFSPVTGVPQIYTKIGNYPIAVNAVPRSITAFDVTVKTTVPGKYKLSLLNPENVKTYSNVTLIDNVTGEQQNMLLDGTYEFTTTSSAAKERFKVIVSGDVATNQYDTKEQKVILYKSNGKMVVSGLVNNTANLKVYDATGRFIQMISNVADKQELSVTNKGMTIITLETVDKKYDFKINL